MKSFYNSAKKSQGFSLLEVLIAIFILVVGVVGAYSAFGNMLAGSSVAKEKLTAAYLAQEGIEIVRNIRDTNWINNTGTKGWSDTISYFADCQSSNGGCEADYTAGVVNGTSFQPWTGRTLYIDPSNTSYSYTPSTSPSIFKRQITVNPMNINGKQDILDVKVNVYWQDRGANYSFPAEEFLYNWDE